MSEQFTNVMTEEEAAEMILNLFKPATVRKQVMKLIKKLDGTTYPVGLGLLVELLSRLIAQEEERCGDAAPMVRAVLTLSFMGVRMAHGDTSNVIKLH